LTIDYTKPIEAKLESKRMTTRLWYPGDVQVEFYLRGGIAWPMPVMRIGKRQLEGFVVMLAYDINTKQAYQIAERRFYYVDHLIREDGGIVSEGVSTFFNKMWQSFYADTYFYRQEETVHHKHQLQVLRSDMVKPKPYFIPVEWQQDQTSLHTVWAWGGSGRFRGIAGGMLHEELKLASLPDAPITPAVYALMACLNGLEQYPWRKPRKF